MNIDEGDDGFNVIALRRAVEALKDHTAAGLDFIRTARTAVRRCIARVDDARLDNGALSNHALDDHLAELLETEREIDRAKAELVD